MLCNRVSTGKTSCWGKHMEKGILQLFEIKYKPMVLSFEWNVAKNLGCQASGCVKSVPLNVPLKLLAFKQFLLTIKWTQLQIE